MYSQSFQAFAMVLEYLQSCHSLVVSNRHSLVLFTCLFVSSLPVPFPLMFVLICLLPTSSLTPWYFSPVTPGIDPRLSLGPELGLSWTFSFAGSRHWTVYHSLGFATLKKTFSSPLNSIWRLVPTHSTIQIIFFCDQI